MTDTPGEPKQRQPEMWFVRGIDPGLKAAVKAQAIAERMTIGQIVTRALLRDLEGARARPVEDDRLAEVEERLARIEQWLTSGGTRTQHPSRVRVDGLRRQYVKDQA